MKPTMRWNMIYAVCKERVITHEAVRLRVHEPIIVNILSTTGFARGSRWVLREFLNEFRNDLALVTDENFDVQELLDPQEVIFTESSREGHPTCVNFSWIDGFRNPGRHHIEVIEFTANGTEYRHATLDLDVATQRKKIPRRLLHRFLTNVIALGVMAIACVLFYGFYQSGIRTGEAIAKQNLRPTTNVSEATCAACPDRVAVPTSPPCSTPEPSCPEPTVCPPQIVCADPIICPELIVCPEPIVCAVCKAPQPPTDPGVRYYR